MDQTLKLVDKPIKAGFPNAADEAVYNKLNLHKLLVKRPSSTYFMRLDGSLGGRSYIHTETILVVDRAAEIQSGDVVVIINRGEMMLKTYKRVGQKHLLVAITENTGGPIGLSDEEETQVWGVVVHIIESVKK